MSRFSRAALTGVHISASACDEMRGGEAGTITYSKRQFSEVWHAVETTETEAQQHMEGMDSKEPASVFNDIHIGPGARAHIGNVYSNSESLHHP